MDSAKRTVKCAPNGRRNDVKFPKSLKIFFIFVERGLHCCVLLILDNHPRITLVSQIKLHTYHLFISPYPSLGSSSRTAHSTSVCKNFLIENVISYGIKTAIAADLKRDYFLRDMHSETFQYPSEISLSFRVSFY
jgi:hypothetical protein